MFAKILHNFFLKLNNDIIELRAVSEKVTKDDLFIKVFLTSMKPVLSFQPTGCYEGEKGELKIS